MGFNGDLSVEQVSSAGEIPITWMITLRGVMGKPELGWKVYVQKVAQHWRVCEWASGPALEGLERFQTREEALTAAEGVLRSMDAAKRLSGG